MKTEDGHLIPVPEKPRKVKCKAPSNIIETDLISEASENSQFLDTNAVTDSLNSDFQLQTICDSNDHNDSIDSPLELNNLLGSAELMPHVLSLVNVNSGQIVTVELTNPEVDTMNDMVDQFETNSNEILNLSDYNDLEFQGGILNMDENYDEQTHYSELELGSAEETSSLLDSSTSKMDALPAIENYLTQPFPSFLNL